MCQKLIAVLVVTAAIACGGGGQEQTAQTSQQAAARPANRLSACSLLTTDEVMAATGWSKVTIDSVPGCNYRGPNELQDVVSVMVSSGLKPMATSAEMAAWRSAQIGADDAIKPRITAVEGLGVPAIRNEIEGMGLVTVEAAKNGYLVDVTANSFDVAKKLTPTALSRVP